MTEIRINERWGYSKDKFQTILIEHYMTAGGRHPVTKAIAAAKPATRETYHPTIRAAILRAIESESEECVDLSDLLYLTDQWGLIAERIAGELNPAAE